MDKRTISLIKKILILVTILAVPGFLYYLLQAKGKNRYKPLAIYGPKVVAETFTEKRGVKIPDTLFHHVKGLTAINQQGDSINIDSIKNQLLVINLFYTGNNKLMDLMYPNLERLYNRYKDNKKLRFLSITIDPKTDTNEVLARFAANYNAPAGKWDFLQADTAKVFPFANKQLFLDAFESEGVLVHSEKVVLIDEERRIRGYYAATSSQEMKKLGEEIKVLIAEELRKIKLVD